VTLPLRQGQRRGQRACRGLGSARRRRGRALPTRLARLLSPLRTPEHHGYAILRVSRRGGEDSRFEWGGGEGKRAPQCRLVLLTGARAEPLVQAPPPARGRGRRRDRRGWR